MTPSDDQTDTDITTMKVCSFKAPLYTAQRFMLDRCTHPEGPTLIRWQEEWYRWRDGQWHKLGEEEFNAEVAAYMREAINPAEALKLKPSHVKDVVGNLRDLAQVSLPGIGCYLDGEPADGLVPCENGTLDVTTGDMLGHTPALFNLSKVPVVYSPKAECPTWLNFLTNVYERDPKRIALLQEWMGYNLTEDNSQQKILLMIGAKRSGKGTIARIMATLAGPQGLASPTLDSLALNFGLQPLMGRKTAIVSDARLAGGGRVNYQATLERLLTISGGNEVTIDRKHIGQWTGMLSTRFTIISNALPAMHDEGAAFASRLLVLHHGVSFYGREDTALTAKLLAELPGILRWAAEGYRRLLRQGAFTTPDQQQEMLDRLDRIASPMKAFLVDRCVLGPTGHASKDELYADYRQWVVEQGLKLVEHKARFFEQLIAASDHSIKPGKRREGEQFVRVLYGVTLRQEVLDN